MSMVTQKNNCMKEEYAYIETPVSEKPLEAGNYICILEGDEGDYSEEILFNGETWHEWEDSTAEYDEPCENIIFWLKKTPISPLGEEFNDRVLQLLTNIGQLLQPVKSEWEAENCWSDWDEEQLRECVNVIRLIYDHKAALQSKTLK